MQEQCKERIKIAYTSLVVAEIHLEWKPEHLSSYVLIKAIIIYIIIIINFYLYYYYY